MGSEYAIFCMSHDPAIVALDDETDLDRVLRLGAEGLGDHPSCDLLVGRYSGALVEVGCPGQGGFDVSARPRPHPGWHRDTMWADAGLLRVVVAVDATEEDGHAAVITKSLTRLPMCWQVGRLRRLRHLLEVAL